MMSPSERNRESTKRRKTKREYLEERLALNTIDERLEHGFTVTVYRTAYAWGAAPQPGATTKLHTEAV